MKQILYRVGIKHRKTGEELKLQVWAENNTMATAGLHGVIGPGTEYRWTGTGPEHDERGNVITREVDERGDVIKAK